MVSNLFKIFLLSILLMNSFCYADNLLNPQNITEEESSFKYKGSYSENYTEQKYKSYLIDNNLDLFEDSDHSIKNKAETILNSFTSKLMRNKNSKVLIKFEHLQDFSNLKIMEDRAMEVEKHFLNSGIQIEQIEVVGFISF